MALVPGVAALGALDRVFPLPGNEDDGVAGGPAEDGPAAAEDGWPLLLFSRTIPSRALSGNSCSERNLTSRPWMRKTFLSRSIHA